MLRSIAPETDEDSLIRTATRGDREAFGQLYEKHALRVFRHVYFLTGDPPLAEDITAQTFLKALEAMPRYEDRGVPFISWLLRIAVNLTINHRKSLKNAVHAQLPESIRAEGAFYSPEHACEVSADEERVWEMVRQLPPEQRQVIVHRFLDDLPYQDIARMLNKSVGAVRVIQFRALGSLRDMIQGDLNTAFLQRARGV